jgi:uncharacterized protein YyaL (SSP411 family)
VSSEPVNRLGECTSPYLLQHAENPVAWQPWDEQAIALARELDRPLLVSIGYAACHWCHVMEHESFENEAMGKVMNDALVCIKVDREERPDVDALYMNACTAMTGSGGWPLNAFVDPHTLKPFFIGTYFPPTPAFNRPSWTQVVESICQAWDEQREDIERTSAMIIERLGQRPPPDADAPDLATQIGMARAAAADHVMRMGNTAPQFPQPMRLETLMRSGELEIVAAELDIMATRGLFDHLAGGWHRYCVDSEWAVPHFEKMLYDNALLLATHARARRRGISTHNDRVIRLTLAWLNTEMLDPDGGVWSTLDADSIGEHGRSEEGEFFLWTPEQVGDEAACERFGVTDEGNFEGSGRSVLSLHEVEDLDDEPIRLKLLKERAKRPRPGTDDKVLTAWNGMLLVACADLPEDEAGTLGEHIVLELLAREEVLRTRRGQTLGGEGFLDDHAWAALGLLRWGLRHDRADCLERSLLITERMLERFHDPEGGFWMTGPDHTELPIRQRSEADSAVPAASAIAVELLATLIQRWPDHENATRWRSAGEGTVMAIGPALIERAGAYCALLNAAEGLLDPGAVWFIHHDGTEPEAVEALRASAEWNQLVVSSATPIEDKDRGDASWVAWRCAGMVCEAPTTAEIDLVWS